jgi:hypothetical protein
VTLRSFHPQFSGAARQISEGIPVAIGNKGQDSARDRLVETNLFLRVGFNARGIHCLQPVLHARACGRCWTDGGTGVCSVTRSVFAISAFGGRRRRLRPPSLEWLDQSVSPWEPLSICACQACAERVEDHMARLARKARSPRATDCRPRPSGYGVSSCASNQAIARPSSAAASAR